MRKIIIVEDNEIERSILVHMLENQYECLEASNGNDFFTILEENKNDISLILLDLFMPQMDGFEVLKRMKNIPSYGQIPVIISSGRSDEETEVKAIKLGAFGYTHKPYNRDLLLPLIQTTIHFYERSRLLNTIKKDRLTGLLSREFFIEKATEMIYSKPQGYYTLSVLNIEGFKVVNDQYGTDIGDKILTRIGEKLLSLSEKIDGITSRFMGDRFCLLYPEEKLGNPALEEAYESCLNHPEINHTLSIRIGRYLILEKNISVNSMYDRAILALTSIKGKYGEHIGNYSQTMTDEIIHEQEIVLDMKNGILNHEFEVFYQPQVNHSSGQIVGAEALVRWRKGDRYISPLEFIPVFERNGFIYEMDQYVWGEVASTIENWKKEKKRNFTYFNQYITSGFIPKGFY